ncbi:hypothetical protein CLV28_1457 [Sediminihabitans luteus]|uniref:LytR cell envelope-related transcriptional attenuator n=1 Tax=Sediminihabitans luteus TaxID=1138585 RepID=A0A2M9CQ64_9CELL|nr:hypothetical protein [Sediminihabitans luteus]PJJ73971.1 hypothetical protein CLV28_1457 [Sediminihabitans luteus]GII98116.1 hypothetical protein Slu03_04940 [Sediminihabitans luteus]
MTRTRALVLLALPVCLALGGCASETPAEDGGATPAPPVGDVYDDVRAALDCDDRIPIDEPIDGVLDGEICMPEGLRPVNVYQLTDDSDATLDAAQSVLAEGLDPDDAAARSIDLPDGVLVIPQDTLQLDDVRALLAGIS